MGLRNFYSQQFSGFFTSLREELREMIHLPDPDKTPAEARRGAPLLVVVLGGGGAVAAV